MNGRTSDDAWPADKVVAEVRRRVEALPDELHGRLADSRVEVNALVAEHAWRREHVLAEVLREAGWAEDDYCVALAEYLER